MGGGDMKIGLRDNFFGDVIRFYCESRSERLMMFGFGWSDDIDSEVYVPMMSRYETSMELLDAMIIGWVGGDRSIALVNLRSENWRVQTVAEILVRCDRVELI